MSRSQPSRRGGHPCTRWYDWSAGKGKITWYDKALKQKREIDLPFRFLLLDVTATITGWHEPTKGSLYSNEIHDTREEEFTIRSFGTTSKKPLDQGFYGLLKETIKSLGGKYTSRLYIAHYDEGELVLGALHFKGAGLRAWMEFQKENKGSLYSGAIVITGTVEGKTGAVTYQMPALMLEAATPEETEGATEIDKVLQAYFAEKNAPTPTEPEPPAEEIPVPVPVDEGEEITF
jgi:hypothetical protein